MLTFKSRQKSQKEQKTEKTFLFHSVIVMLLVFHMLRSAWCICCMLVCGESERIVFDAFLFHSTLFENWVRFNLIKGDDQVDLLLRRRRRHHRYDFVLSPFCCSAWVSMFYVVTSLTLVLILLFPESDMLRKYHTQYPFTITLTHAHTHASITGHLLLSKKKYIEKEKTRANGSFKYVNASISNTAVKGY